MPNLPVYTSPMAERGLQPSSLGVDAKEMEGRAWNTAFHQLGEDVKQASDAIDRHNQMEDATNLAQQSADFEIQQEQSKKAAEAQGVSPIDWYNKTYLPSLDQFQSQVQPNSPAGYARMQEWAAKHKASTFQNAAGEQSTFDANNSVTAVQSSTDKFSNLAVQHPENAGDYAGQAGYNIENLARAAQLPPDKVSELKLKSRQTIYDSAVKGIVARAESPNATPDQIEAAKQTLLTDEWTSNTSPNVYVSAMDSLTKAKGQQINIQGNIAALALGDVRKQIETTGDLDMYQKGLGLISNIRDATPAATAMKQAEETKKLNDAFAAGRVTSGVMTAPAADLAKGVSDFDALYKSETDPQKLGVLGAQRTAIDTALKRRDTELKQDASKYALTYSKTVQQTYQDYQHAPPEQRAQAFDRYAQTSVAFQQMVNPGKPANVLTDDMRTEARQAVSSLKTPGGPAQAAGALSQMAQNYGQYWPQITEQLRKEKVFSGDEGVAARLYANPASQALGETILNASAATGAERFGMHMIPQEKAMALASPALAPLAKSLGNTGAAGADFMNAYTNALAHAIQYTGVNDANGVSVYARKMALDQFTFPKAMPTLRISNSLRIDGDRAADGALAVQRDIASHQLFVPTSYSGLNTKDQTANYAKQIASTGKWYTNESGTGALLYDEDGHNVQEFRNGKRVDVELKWEDLGQVADKQPGRAAFKAAAGAVDKLTGSK